MYGMRDLTARELREVERALVSLWAGVLASCAIEGEEVSFSEPPPKVEITGEELYCFAVATGIIS